MIECKWSCSHNKAVGFVRLMGEPTAFLHAHHRGFAEMPQKAKQLAFCRRGGIGRHARLKIVCRKACRFDSDRRHHKEVFAMIQYIETHLGIQKHVVLANPSVLHAHILDEERKGIKKSPARVFNELAVRYP